VITDDTPCGADHSAVHPVAVKLLGHPCRRLARSRDRYRRAYPDHLLGEGLVVRDGRGVDLWHGDLDLTVCLGRLRAIAAWHGGPVAVYTTVASMGPSRDPLLTVGAGGRVEVDPLVAVWRPDGSIRLLADHDLPAGA